MAKNNIGNEAGYHYLAILDEARGRIIKILVPFLVLFFFTFAFSARTGVLLGIRIYYPYFDIFSSFGIKAVVFLESYLLPSGMHIINVNAFDAVGASVMTSLLIALFITMPFIIYEAFMFSAPALRRSERRALKIFVIPAFVMFVFGVAFSFFIFLPLVFGIFYDFMIGMHITPYLGVRSFINTAFAFMLAFGISFELPVFMAGTSYAGVIDSKVYFDNWRYAVVGAFFIALLISPGATGGLIEVGLGLLLSGLYAMGLAAAKFADRKH